MTISTLIDPEGHVRRLLTARLAGERAPHLEDSPPAHTPRRITLIEPESSGYHWFTGIPLPRLGLPILGAILKARGHDVEVFCECVAPIDYARAHTSDLLMISALTNTAPAAYRLADRFRAEGIPVVLGGPHPTFMPDEALEHADFVLRGECERSLPEFMDAWESGRSMDGILGLSYRGDGGARHNPDVPFLEDLDEMPFPDLTLVRGHESIGIMPVQTSRGCPFECTFCSVTRMWGRSYRTRSVASVMEELTRIGDRDVFFYDDHLMANRGRVKRLLREMLGAGVPRRWRAQSRVDIAEDTELLELMRATRCHILYIGFESVNPRTLVAYKKRQTVADMRRCVERLHEFGIGIHGMFVLGGEDDDEDTIVETARFARATGIDAVQFWLLTPYPGTRTRELLEGTGRIFTNDWTLYDGQHVVFEPKRLTPFELQSGAFRAVGEFYSWWRALVCLVTLRFRKQPYELYALLFMAKWRAANRSFMRWLSARGTGAAKTASPQFE